MIVDTSFLLDLIARDEDARAKQRELDRRAVPLVIPSMALLELYTGVETADSTAEERQHVGAILDSYPLVEMTPSMGRRAGYLLGRRIAEAPAGEGPGIGKGDAAIAATALARDEPVLAGDSHFSTIENVDHVGYR